MTQNTPEQLSDRCWALYESHGQKVWFTAIAAHMYGRDQAMYRHSGGRNFQQLCDLVGQTAEVRVSEVEYSDGWRDHRSSWTERLTIQEFQGAHREPAYNDEGDFVGYQVYPCFLATSEHGRTYLVSAEDLTNIQPAG